MQPGDLVHVKADNFYYGIGLIIEYDEAELPGCPFYVMTSDGKCLFYFGEELEPVQHDPP